MYLCIGKYVSTHGIKGEIRISLNDFLLLDKKKMTILSREDVVNILFKKNAETYFVSSFLLLLVIVTINHMKCSHLMA